MFSIDYANVIAIVNTRTIMSVFDYITRARDMTPFSDDLIFLVCTSFGKKKKKPPIVIFDCVIFWTK